MCVLDLLCTLGIDDDLSLQVCHRSQHHHGDQQRRRQNEWSHDYTDSQTANDWKDEFHAREGFISSHAQYYNSDRCYGILLWAIN